MYCQNFANILCQPEIVTISPGRSPGHQYECSLSFSIFTLCMEEFSKILKRRCVESPIDTCINKT